MLDIRLAYHYIIIATLEKDSTYVLLPKNHKIPWPLLQNKYPRTLWFNSNQQLTYEQKTNSESYGGSPNSSLTIPIIHNVHQ